MTGPSATPTAADPVPDRVPVPRPTALDTTLAWSAAPGLVGLAVAVGALFDLAVRSGSATLGGALLVAGTSAALLASGRLRTRSSRWLVTAAPLFGMWLALRTSDWLLPLDVVAAFGLLALGASLSGGGSLFDLTLPAVGQRFVLVALHGIEVPLFLQPVVRGVAARAGAHPSVVPAVRGVVLAVPVLAVLGGLLASADAVFASILRVEVGGWDLVGHGLLVIAGAWGMLGLLRTASATAIGPRPRHDLRLGRTELTVLLGSVALLFAGFAAAQLVALSGGGRHVVETAGLTYAEYARSGFFQLLWVAGLTVVLLLGLRALVREDDTEARRRFRRLALLVVALTLVIVVVALRRLGLYQEAFGLTMLRLYCSVFAAWVGLVVLSVGAAIAGAWPQRSWLPGAALVSGLVVILALNIANPEAIVVRHNVDRLADGRTVDGEYLAEGLSLDAVPTLVDRLPSLDEATRRELLASIGCPEPGHGWAGWNRSRSAAVAALADPNLRNGRQIRAACARL